MDKTLQQIKDEWAKDHGYIDYKEFYELTRAVDTYQVFIMDGAVNQISIRYAQEQNRELQAWKESASKILHNIDLQKLGKLLDMQYGTAIDEQLLPHVTKLVHHNRELVAMLERCLSFIDELKNHGITNWSEERELRDLITKHKQS